VALGGTGALTANRHNSNPANAAHTITSPCDLEGIPIEGTVALARLLFARPRTRKFTQKWLKSRINKIRQFDFYNLYIGYYIKHQYTPHIFADHNCMYIAQCWNISNAANPIKWHTINIIQITQLKTTLANRQFF